MKLVKVIGGIACVGAAVLFGLLTLGIVTAGGLGYTSAQQSLLALCLASPFALSVVALLWAGVCLIRSRGVPLPNRTRRMLTISTLAPVLLSVGMAVYLRANSMTAKDALRANDAAVQEWEATNRLRDASSPASPKQGQPTD